MFDWLQDFADWLIYNIIGIQNGTHLGASLNFFVYETFKVLLLLAVIIFLMGIINSYFPTEKIRNYLAKNKLFGLEYLFASLFGAATPFCSCSSVPLFIGFVQGRIPLGVTFAFLITSPLVNEVAIALFLSMFGIKTTLVYVISGVLLGTLGGWLLGKLHLEHLLSPWAKEVLQNAQHASNDLKDTRSFRERLPEILTNAWGIINGVIIYIIIGVGIGAAIHGYVPEDFFTKHLGDGQWWTIPLAVILSVPMYANAAAIVPVIQVFVAKGVPIGTAIAFMMGTVGLSIPEATMLKKVMSWRLISIFFGVVALFITISGYLFNLILS